MERLDQHRSHPPVDALHVAADAARALWEAAPPSSVREAIGDRDVRQDAVDGLEAYQQLQPEHVGRRAMNAHLRAWPWQKGEEP
jgi:hypothetical protein